MSDASNWPRKNSNIIKCIKIDLKWIDGGFIDTIYCVLNGTRSRDGETVSSAEFQ